MPFDAVCVFVHAASVICDQPEDKYRRLELYESAGVGKGEGKGVERVSSMYPFATHRPQPFDTAHS